MLNAFANNAFNKEWNTDMNEDEIKKYKANMKKPIIRKETLLSKPMKRKADQDISENIETKAAKTDLNLKISTNSKKYNSPKIIKSNLNYNSTQTKIESYLLKSFKSQSKLINPAQDDTENLKGSTAQKRMKLFN